MRTHALLFWALLCLPASLLPANTINFEGFSDGTFLSTQYPGLIFSNAEILTAGVSLNELEFPPHSGVNVVSDFSGPLSISFADPVYSVGGYFTYTTTLALAAYDSAAKLVGSVSSAFNVNEKLSGDPGSHPNEFLEITSPVAITSLTITGDPSGGSFVLDDLTYSTISPVPEPSCFLLAFCLPLTVVGVRLSRNRAQRTRWTRLNPPRFLFCLMPHPAACALLKKRDLLTR